jgi:hypothetical protein
MGALHQRHLLFRLRKVAGERDTLIAKLSRCSFEILLRDVSDDNTRTTLLERVGERQPNPGSAARHQHDFACVVDHDPASPGR